MDNKSIGVIGGGQLCKMLVEAGIKWDLEFNVLESDKTPSICSRLAKCVRGSLHDPDCIQAIANMSNIVTYELEDINVNKLLELESKGKTIIPSPKILKLIQNKAAQKEFMLRNGLPVAKFTTFTNKNELNEILKTYEGDKFVVKSCVGGYDGNGVLITSMDKIGITELFPGPYLFEEFVECKKELSTIVARDQQGNMVCYPIVEMIFNERNTLDYQISPTDLSKEIEVQAKQISMTLIDKLRGVGIFAVEMFLTSSDKVLINEVSPRPHNSGHYTIECSDVSQYEQLLRILLGYPVKRPTVTRFSITMNLLGPENHTGPYELANRDGLMSVQDCHIHLYGKQPSAPNRKLGHVTIIDDDMDRLRGKFNAIKDHIRIVPSKSVAKKELPVVGIIMGSVTDKQHMQDAIDVLNQFKIPYEVNIVSAHRTPDLMFKYAEMAESKGMKVIIAGAGGAAHLPGMTSSLTNLPVIGVPVKTDAMSGLDSLYSIVQMPRGVPVATMAINGSKNAGILAVRILALTDPSLNIRLQHYVANMHDEAVKSNSLL
jgi:phosphoribosylaminoimidazole carboxylase